MNNDRKLPNGIELVKEDTFWPEGRWSFRRGDLLWSRVDGWQKNHVVDRKNSYFKTRIDAMKAWESSSH